MRLSTSNVSTSFRVSEFRSPSLAVTLYGALWRLTRTFHYARRSTLVDDIIAAIQKVLFSCHCHFISVFVQFLLIYSTGWFFSSMTLSQRTFSRQILLSVCAFNGPSFGATLIWQRQRRRRQQFFINLIEPQPVERK